jgi:DNA-binding CsgD family transcriptional regulator
MTTDLVSVVEAAYSLDLDEPGWVGGIAEALRPAFDRGLGVTAWVFEKRGSEVTLRSFVSDSDPRFEGMVRFLHENGPSEGTEAAYGRFPACASVSQMFATAKNPEAWPFFARNVRKVGVTDVVGLGAMDPSGIGVAIFWPSPTLETVTRAERSRWNRLAAHITAGLRLRLGLGGGEREAVLAPDGRCVHAEGPAKHGAARERLRAAARCLDRARGPLRRNDPEEAVAIWMALCSGRWSIVDHFDTDGRRFLVARRNGPQAEKPAGLTLRERQVAAFLALGYQNKLIAYSLGLSESTVETHTRHAMKKLKARSRVELVGLLSTMPHPPTGVGQTA